MARETPITTPAGSSSRNRQKCGAMAFRAVIYSQILWIVFVGLLSREVIPFPSSEFRWLDKTLSLLVVLAFVAFPLMVITCLLYYRPPDWKLCMILFVEAGLTCAYGIALLPSVQ